MATFIIKGSAVAGTLSDNNLGIAKFVRVVATAGTNTVTVKDSSGNIVGTVYLHAAGDTITIEKNHYHTISSSAAISATAVISDAVGHR